MGDEVCAQQFRTRIRLRVSVALSCFEWIVSCSMVEFFSATPGCAWVASALAVKDFVDGS
jgi:hypothetical protein